MPRYAQINVITGEVVSDSQLLETSAENLILISDDFDLTNKKWDFNTISWVEYTPDPIELESEEEYVSNNEIRDMISNIEKTQLTLIQQAVEKSNNELRQEGADTAILELIKKGIL